MVHILRPQSATVRDRLRAETHKSEPSSRYQPVRPSLKRNAQRIRPQSAIATSKVLKEEIAFQRHATVQGHAIYFQLQGTLYKKKKELEALQQRLCHSVQKNEVPFPKAKSFQALENEIVRQEMYQKRLKHVIHELERQIQTMRSTLNVLEDHKCTLEREFGSLEKKLMQERNAVTEWDRRRKCVGDERERNRQHWMIGWTSMQYELDCRKKIFIQRQRADQQRHGILQIIQALPMQSIKGGDAKKDASRDHMPLILPHNSFLVEAEYDKLLSGTNEVHGQIVLDRFRAFETSRKHFDQTEQDLIKENENLRLHCDAQNELLCDLESSLVVPISEQKRTESLTEQLASMTMEKTQAKNKYLQSLRSLSRIQQGIQNIFSLLQCLESTAVTDLDALDPFVSMLSQSLLIAMKINWSLEPLTDDQSLRFSQIMPEYGTSGSRSSILDSRFQLTNGSHTQNGLPIAIQRLRNASRSQMANGITSPLESMEEDEEDHRQMRQAIKVIEQQKLKEIHLKMQKELKALTRSIDSAEAPKSEKTKKISREAKGCS
uniref:AlNc14C384G11249 protein n=1 Tax=Albugo laibachii Nc14 TaxID=890382 RepID=F0WYI7_9STRA|nr:AlNc14C384G11249 [Albugo laibachii Nc14]|eukprot:CCA26544.1 AlNc14C384G11249 [Albugo laibachii Nc14]